MKTVLRWLVLAMVVLTCVGAGYAAYTLAGISWNAVVDYTSPYPRLKVPPSVGGSAEVTTTVLVVVDGLRLDVSREMGTLNILRQYGADLELTVPQPSLSYPNWTTILSGAPPYVSGVVTNWHEGRAPVETLFDTAKRVRVPIVFVGPQDFETLYGVKEKCAATYMKKWDKRYLTGEYVDAALRLAKERNPRLLVVHLPDIDEAGHDSGGASAEYRNTAARVDADLRRLVEGLQGEHTTFVVVADHGHINGGGHGGWESDVVTVPGIFSGGGVDFGRGNGRLEDVAPTVAVLAGVPVPRFATGVPQPLVLGSEPSSGKSQAQRALQRFNEARIAYVTEPLGVAGTRFAPSVAAQQGEGWRLGPAEDARRSLDKTVRLPLALGGAAAAVVAIVLVGLASWRALVSALVGTIGYYAVYNALFFGVHRYLWSLSAFNSEDQIGQWMNQRLLEALVAGVVAVVAAAIVYPLLRKWPKGPKGRYLPGWLTLGPATLLVTLATLGLQVAWFYFEWGVTPVWRLPDLKWGFKYDLDLIQATALGFFAVLAPLVTYVVGRYHPKVRTSHSEE